MFIPQQIRYKQQMSKSGDIIKQIWWKTSRETEAMTTQSDEMWCVSAHTFHFWASSALGTLLLSICCMKSERGQKAGSVIFVHVEESCHETYNSHLFRLFYMYSASLCVPACHTCTHIFIWTKYLVKINASLILKCPVLNGLLVACEKKIVCVCV